MTLGFRKDLAARFDCDRRFSDSRFESVESVEIFPVRLSHIRDHAPLLDEEGLRGRGNVVGLIWAGCQ